MKIHHAGDSGQGTGDRADSRPVPCSLSPVPFFLAFLLPAAAWAADPTQDDVFRSIQDNMKQPGDLSAILAVLAAASGLAVLLILINQRRRRQVAPHVVHDQARLLKEIAKAAELKPAELKRLKALAERVQAKGGVPVQNPLTLLLCPSLLARAASAPKKRS